MVQVEKQQVHRMSESVLQAEGNDSWCVELRRDSWVKTVPGRWGEGSELDPEGSESQREVVSQGVIYPVRAPKTNTLCGEGLEGSPMETWWKPGDQ